MLIWKCLKENGQKDRERERKYKESMSYQLNWILNWMVFTGWNIHTAAVTSNDNIRWIRAIETFISTMRMKRFFQKLLLIIQIKHLSSSSSKFGILFRLKTFKRRCFKFSNFKIKIDRLRSSEFGFCIEIYLLYMRTSAYQQSKWIGTP